MMVDQFIHVERVEPAENNLGRLWEIDRLVESIADGRLSFSEGNDQLERVITAPWTYSLWANAFSWALIGGSFAALLSSNAQDSIAAGLEDLARGGRALVRTGYCFEHSLEEAAMGTSISHNRVRCGAHR